MDLSFLFLFEICALYCPCAFTFSFSVLSQEKKGAEVIECLQKKKLQVESVGLSSPAPGRKSMVNGRSCTTNPAPSEEASNLSRRKVDSEITCVMEDGDRVYHEDAHQRERFLSLLNSVQTIPELEAAVGEAERNHLPQQLIDQAKLRLAATTRA
jgi:hypothetical protein